jgi:8-oxo-dGTP pyrophosphatase MutT (NUDIX family)
MTKIENCWKILDSEVAYDAGFLKLFKDRVSLNKKKEADFYHFETFNWVNIIAVTNEEQLILIRQFRHGIQETNLEIPGGCIDPTDRSPIDAAIRELKEETGYAGGKATLIGSVSPNPALQNNRCYTVLISGVEQKFPQRLDDMEMINVELYSFNKVKEFIRSGELDHGLVLNAIYFYELYIDNMIEE